MEPRYIAVKKYKEWNLGRKVNVRGNLKLSQNSARFPSP